MFVNLLYDFLQISFMLNSFITSYFMVFGSQPILFYRSAIAQPVSNLIYNDDSFSRDFSFIFFRNNLFFILFFSCNVVLMKQKCGFIKPRIVLAFRNRYLTFHLSSNCFGLRNSYKRGSFFI